MKKQILLLTLFSCLFAYASDDFRTPQKTQNTDSEPLTQGKTVEAASRDALHLKALPTESSFLHDGSPLIFDNSQTKFDIITPQLLLSAKTAKAQDQKNLGLYAYRFFFKENGVVRVEDVSINHDPFKEGGFDEKSMTGDNFDMYLGLLEEHCDPKNKELSNLMKCMVLEDTDPTHRKTVRNIFFIQNKEYFFMCVHLLKKNYQG
jgi:hypothetical protein